MKLKTKSPVNNDISDAQNYGTAMHFLYAFYGPSGASPLYYIYLQSWLWGIIVIEPPWTLQCYGEKSGSHSHDTIAPLTRISLNI